MALVAPNLRILGLRVPIGRTFQHTRCDEFLACIKSNFFKLSREPQLNLGYVRHRPDQVHPLWLRHHCAERSLRPARRATRATAPPLVIIRSEERRVGK